MKKILGAQDTYASQALSLVVVVLLSWLLVATVLRWRWQIEWIRQGMVGMYLSKESS